MTKNKVLSNYKMHVNLETRWRDLDAFGHVNNAVFATYIETARGTLFKRWNLPFNGSGKSLTVAAISINYHKQLKHPSKIIVGQSITRIGNTSFDVESTIFDEKNTNDAIATSKVVVVCFDFNKQKPTPVFQQIINDFEQ